MKQIKFFIFSILAFATFSCQKESSINFVGSNQHLESRTSANCTFIPELCIRPFEPTPPTPDFPNASRIVYNSIGQDYKIYAVDYLTNGDEYLIEKNGEHFILTNTIDEYTKSFDTIVPVPKGIGKLFSLSFSKITSNSVTNTELSDAFNYGTSINRLTDGTIRIQENSPYTGNDPQALVKIDWCKFVIPATVKRYKEKLMDIYTTSPSTNDAIDKAIEQSIKKCTPKLCLDCANPKCVVNELINNPNISGASLIIEKIKLNFVALLLKLTPAQKANLVPKKDLINEIFDDYFEKKLMNSSTASRSDACITNGCGKLGGYHEIINLESNNVTLSEEDKGELLDFFNILKCDDPDLFNCFRSAQQNPGSNIDLLLTDIKQTLLSNTNALLDGCDNLPNYTDRWFDLSTFNPLSVPAVKTKLEQLGDDYWIQTLENASNPNNKWWQGAPSVNMDFFGIKITQFPFKPGTSTRFTPNEFFSYLQNKFATIDFMGEGNACYTAPTILPPGPAKGGQFEALNSAEAANWIDGTPITSVFTIEMADEGNVICTKFANNSSWVFSTLNAPGWLEGGSWDGYHPVSGNRQFGIIPNPDGSFTFYTSGVDRLTSWWHRITDATVIDAFTEADNLWKCFLDQIKEFVESNNGSVSSNYDCTTVRPKWQELKNAIKKGCDGLSNSIDNFPCEQSEACD
ncbi:MAG: hypothetical protein RLZZ546_2637 [Bacteroidota bacterium]